MWWATLFQKVGVLISLCELPLLTRIKCYFSTILLETTDDVLPKASWLLIKEDQVESQSLISGTPVTTVPPVVSIRRDVTSQC